MNWCELIRSPMYCYVTVVKPNPVHITMKRSGSHHHSASTWQRRRSLMHRHRQTQTPRF